MERFARFRDKKTRWKKINFNLTKNKYNGLTTVCTRNMETEFKISNKKTTSNNLFYQVNNHTKHGKNVGSWKVKTRAENAY